MCNDCQVFKRPFGRFEKGREGTGREGGWRERAGGCTLIKCDLAARRIASCAPHWACDGVMKEKRQQTTWEESDTAYFWTGGGGRGGRTVITLLHADGAITQGGQLELKQEPNLQILTCSLVLFVRWQTRLRWLASRPVAPRGHVTFAFIQYYNRAITWNQCYSQSRLEAAVLQMDLSASRCPTVAQWLQRLFKPTNDFTFFCKPLIDVYVFLFERELNS